MARTKIIVHGDFGLPGGHNVPSEVVQLTVAEEANCDKLDAVHLKMVAAHVHALSKVTALVPSWDTWGKVRKAIEDRDDDTPPKRAAIRIANLSRRWIGEKFKQKSRALATVAAINAIDPTSADPFGDGQGWPT